MRLTSEFWISAYLRQCQTQGLMGVVEKRGAKEAGAIFIKIDYLDGHIALFTPAPQSFFDDENGGERIFSPLWDKPGLEEEAHDYLQREQQFDPDFWIITIESRNGQHFLPLFQEK